MYGTKTRFPEVRACLARRVVFISPEGMDMKMLIERAFIYSAKDKSRFVALTAYRMSVLTMGGRMAQLRETDIDVGRDLMATKRGGCVVVFSQPSCRTVETRRPGLEWRRTFGMRESLQQS